jgi:hypothetical protein
MKRDAKHENFHYCYRFLTAFFQKTMYIDIAKALPAKPNKASETYCWHQGYLGQSNAKVLGYWWNLKNMCLCS